MRVSALRDHGLGARELHPVSLPLHLHRELALLGVLVSVRVLERVGDLGQARQERAPNQNTITRAMKSTADMLNYTGAARIGY